MSQTLLTFESSDLPAKSISPLLELGAYELLWSRQGSSYKSIAEQLQKTPGAMLSDLVDHNEALQMANKVVSIMSEKGVPRFGVRIHRAGEYPLKLRDAEHPVELLYYRGFWDLVETPSLAIVGTRKPSTEGKKLTEELVRYLVKNKWTIVSGLAEGIDTVAHKTAKKTSGRTIAVIGTPLCEVYPRKNAELQEQIAKQYLLISQVPVFRYYQQIWKQNRLFFPARNVTMSALTKGTVIVEAGNTSGTLIQARAALQQGRKLFILDHCFQTPGLTWPRNYEKKGAIRVKDFSQILKAVASADI
jgi:DNA processing protein